MKLIRAFALGAAAGYALGSGKISELIARFTSSCSDEARPGSRTAAMADVPTTLGTYRPSTEAMAAPTRAS